MWLDSYKPKHEENRMHDEGNVKKARDKFLSKPTPNLKFLLENRYSWMNDYIKGGSKGLEVGAGTGISKFFIKADSYILSDYNNNEWLDVKNVDALKTPFADKSFDFVVTSNMIHHVPCPVKFFREMSRLLKHEGYLLIQEINASFFMRLALRLMRHEGYSFKVNVFDENAVCTDPDDLWSANCAIPNLLFDDQAKFEREIPYFKIIESDFSEFFLFLNSGGVIAKTFYIPLPVSLLKTVKMLDDFLCSCSHSIFALQRQLVLQKVADEK